MGPTRVEKAFHLLLSKKTFFSAFNMFSRTLIMRMKTYSRGGNEKRSHLRTASGWKRASLPHLRFERRDSGLATKMDKYSSTIFLLKHNINEKNERKRGAKAYLKPWRRLTKSFSPPSVRPSKNETEARGVT